MRTQAVTRAATAANHQSSDMMTLTEMSLAASNTKHAERAAEKLKLKFQASDYSSDMDSDDGKGSS